MPLRRPGGEERMSDKLIQWIMTPILWLAVRSVSQDWPRQVEVGAGHSSPVVVGRRVFVHARQGEDDLTLENGKALGSRRYPAPYVMNSAARRILVRDVASGSRTIRRSERERRESSLGQRRTRGREAVVLGGDGLYLLTNDANLIVARAVPRSFRDPSALFGVRRRGLIPCSSAKGWP
jgi:hypothetical protein